MPWEVQASTTCRAQPGAVWKLWSNPKRWPDWNDQIRRAELDGPFEPGTVARIKYRGGGTIEFTIIEVDPERRFVDESRLPGARLGHEHRLQPLGDRTEISHRFYLTGPLARLYVVMMGRRLRKSVAAFPERERELAEGRRPR